MELGLTFPLQRFLKMKTPDYGILQGSPFCWDLHGIDLRGRKSLLAVHCQSRFVVVLHGLSFAQWNDLSSVFLEGVKRSLESAGFPPKQLGTYFQAAGELTYTRTHGRREVAFLNRAWEDVMALDFAVDESAREQPVLEQAVNGKRCRCAGFPGLGTGEERMREILS